MSSVITSACVGNCENACMQVCPVDCIIGPYEGQMVIDPDECTNCGACIDECPVDAIFDETAVPAQHHAAIARNAEGARLIRLRLKQHV